MNIRVRKAAVVLLALSLCLNATSVFAAPRERDFQPTFVQRIIKTIKKIVRPAVGTHDDETPKPGPPIP